MRSIFTRINLKPGLNIQVINNGVAEILLFGRLTTAINQAFPFSSVGKSNQGNQKSSDNKKYTKEKDNTNQGKQTYKKKENEIIKTIRTKKQTKMSYPDSNKKNPEIMDKEYRKGKRLLLS